MGLGSVGCGVARALWTKVANQLVKKLMLPFFFVFFFFYLLYFYIQRKGGFHKNTCGLQKLVSVGRSFRYKVSYFGEAVDFVTQGFQSRVFGHVTFWA